MSGSDGCRDSSRAVILSLTSRFSLRSLEHLLLITGWSTCDEYDCIVEFPNSQLTNETQLLQVRPISNPAHDGHTGVSKTTTCGRKKVPGSTRKIAMLLDSLRNI